MNQLQGVIVGTVSQGLRSVQTPAELRRATKAARIVMRNNELFLSSTDYHDTADDVQVEVLQAYLRLKKGSENGHATG